MVLCKICNKELKTITQLHLKKHGTNLEKYQVKYGACKKQTNTGKTHFTKSHMPWNKGMPWSEEIKRKLSESHIGKSSWNKGKNLSQEHKMKLSIAHKGRKVSKEVRNKIAETLRGKKFTDERKKKISLSLKGRKLSAEWRKKTSKNWFKKNDIPWNKGKELSEETKKRISNAVKGGKWVNEKYRNKMRETMKRKWETEEYRRRFIKGMENATKITPNKIEIRMINIMNENNFPFIFVGNGKFWIRDKNTSYNPDFLHRDKTQRKIIEIFGDYWHNKEDHKNRDVQRIKTYKEKGFDVLVIWENQIKRSVGEVIKQINNFLENGIQK